MVFFTFPDDASWNEARQSVEFSIEIGDYQGRVFVPRALFRGLIATGRPDDEACLAAFHGHQSHFERAAQRRVYQRRLDPDGNLTLTSGDLAAITKELPE